MAVRIVDIASRLNVSHTTVSRVLNNRQGGFISDRTRQRILEVAREMDYRPNPLARGLRGAKTNTLGIAVPGLFKYIEPVEEMATRAGYRVHVATHHRDPADLRRVIQDFGFQSVDGILVHSLVDSITEILQQHAAGKPVVLCTEEPVEGFDCFIDARYESTRLAMDYLGKLGHRRIGLVVNHTMPQMRWRTRGYVDGLRELGVELDRRLMVDMPNDVPSAPRGYAGMKAALAQWSVQDRPTAVLCTNDEVAVGVLAAVAEAGIRVPEDLSVVGMMNLDNSAFARVPLTTVDWEAVGLIVKGTKRLMERIQSPTLQPIVRPQQPRIVERKSTAEPRPTGGPAQR